MMFVETWWFCGQRSKDQGTTGFATMNSSVCRVFSFNHVSGRPPGYRSNPYCILITYSAGMVQVKAPLAGKRPMKNALPGLIITLAERL